MQMNSNGFDTLLSKLEAMELQVREQNAAMQQSLEVLQRVSSSECKRRLSQIQFIRKCVDEMILEIQHPGEGNEDIEDVA